MLMMIMLCLIGLSGSAAGTIRVACLGDSDTYGYGLPDREYNCYPAQLERILKEVDSRYETRNFGVNGATVLQRGDKPYMRQNAYHDALEYEPDVVVFHFGGNATRPPNRGYIAEHYDSDYNALIDVFAELPNKPKIVICQSKGFFSTNWGDAPTIIVEQLVPLIAGMASARGLPLVDFHSVFSKLPELYVDGIHLDIEGTGMMAEMVAAELLKVRFSPDFTGDLKVDIADLNELVGHMGTGDPAFDLVPAPDGDGLVDTLDLEAFMKYWGDELALVGHWPLDEADGKIAQNTADWRTPGMLESDPVWIPFGGHLNGAIELDGIDDYVSTYFLLDPADGQLSVFAWIKGGAPGQVIISQADGFGSGGTWLGADPLNGKLMTEIVIPPVGRHKATLLESEFIITDGNWHHVGFVWDSSYRFLYVDGIEVAKDTNALTQALMSSDGGLYLGAGKDLDVASFFSGLIDDVRVYNQALNAEDIAALAQ
jgi:lysophospholipase L1-like esterase